MSGHSKWAQIKRKKGATDVKRGKLFSQLTKAITVAARTGQNLDMAVARAKAANMPADNIDRAIKKGTGELNDGTQIEELTYELYGPGGAAILVGVLTDNRNRSVNELKAVLNKQGGRLAESGSVQYLFDRKGLIDVQIDESIPSEEVELALIEAGAEEIDEDDDRFVITVAPNELMAAKHLIEEAHFSVVDAKLSNVAKLTINLSPNDEAKLVRFMEALDDLDDVEAVETNADLSD